VAIEQPLNLISFQSNQAVVVLESIQSYCMHMPESIYQIFYVGYSGDICMKETIAFFFSLTTNYPENISNGCK
jgi:hypothetical protein